jgi:hypothetical protein
LINVQWAINENGSELSEYNKWVVVLKKDGNGKDKVKVNKDNLEFIENINF